MTNRSISLSDILDRVISCAETRPDPWFRELALAANLDPSMDFIGASLTALDLRDEDLRGFNFRGADLRGADFRRANVQGVCFDDAQLEGAIGLVFSPSPTIDDVLADQLRALLPRLGEQDGFGQFDLLDIFAMIVAMHAENQAYLSRRVLASALNCDERALRSILRVLEQEGMVWLSKTYVGMRHDLIAQTARDVLEQAGYNLNKWYPYLAKSAVHMFAEMRSADRDLDHWRFTLANHFVAKGESSWPIAREVAREIFELNPNDISSFMFYSKVLRATNFSHQAMELFKLEIMHLGITWEFLYEWSAIANEIGNVGLSCWLLGRSLADGGTPPTRGNCKLSLTALGSAFRVLHTATSAHGFLEAEAACGRLGGRLNAFGDSDLRDFERRANAEKGRSSTSMVDVETLIRYIAHAKNKIDSEDDLRFFDNLLGEPWLYRYTGLLQLQDAG